MSQAQEKNVKPVEGSSYAQLFGTAVGSDVVVPKVPAKTEDVPVEGGFDEYFGGSVTHTASDFQAMYGGNSTPGADVDATAAPSTGGGGGQKVVWGTGGTFVEERAGKAHRVTDEVESAQAQTASAPEGFSVKVRHGVGTFITSKVKRALVIFGTQPACHQAALLIVEEIATTRAFESITIAGATPMDYCGIGSDLANEIRIDLDRVDAGKLAGHDVAFCIMGI